MPSPRITTRERRARPRRPACTTRTSSTPSPRRVRSRHRATGSVLAAPLALGASASWGVGDFLGGVKSRTLHPLAIMAVSQPVGLVASRRRRRRARDGARPGPEVAWAAPAAVVGTIGARGLLPRHGGRRDQHRRARSPGRARPSRSLVGVAPRRPAEPPAGRRLRGRDRRRRALVLGAATRPGLVRRRRRLRPRQHGRVRLLLRLPAPGERRRLPLAGLPLPRRLDVARLGRAARPAPGR